MGIAPGQAMEEVAVDRIFLDAGFKCREPGCSVCLGMNPDARTHLMSPAMAAAAGVARFLAEVRDYLRETA